MNSESSFENFAKDDEFLSEDSESDSELEEGLAEGGDLLEEEDENY
ncbi:MAG: hypothetical protein Q8Q37_01925 [bacterium]|nr:hypothetical protein [bacterium]